VSKPGFRQKVLVIMLLLILLLVIIFIITIYLLNYQSSRKFYSSHKSGAIFVTGAGSGIGRHVVEYLAKKYPQFIIIFGVRKKSDADDIISSNQMVSESLYPVIIDISDTSSISAAVSQIKQLLIDKNTELRALVNNAGVARGCPLEYHPVDDIRQLFEVNVFGTMSLTQQLLPLLRQGDGRVVTLSSIAGVVG